MTVAKQDDDGFSVVVIRAENPLSAGDFDAMLADYAAQAIPLVANGLPTASDELILKGLNVAAAAEMARDWNAQDGTHGDVIVVNHVQDHQEHVATAVPVSVSA